MRRKNAFDFKQFKVKHDRCTMKVGTDAVLLGAWVNVEGAFQILDVGTGSGVIALMMAQRTSDSTKIDALEIEEADAQQAIENVVASPWPDKVNVHHISLQHFNPTTKYDLIVSNPPFFSNSQLPPSEKRKSVRHTETLTHGEVLSASRKLLTHCGRLAVVLPTTEGDLFKAEAKAGGFFCNRSLAFYTREHKPQERWLFEFSFYTQAQSNEKLVLYNAAEEWSASYLALTKEFYLPR